MTRSTTTESFRRLKLLRQRESLRSLAQETHLSPGRLIQPLFAVPGENVRKEIDSLPGQFHLSIDELVKEGEELQSLGITAILLFGLPATKDNEASGAYDPDGTVQQAVRALKQATPNLIVITDVCLCQYTNHSHCGIITDGAINNDKTLPILAKTAVSHADAGADVVAPSDMMDGRITVIRSALDQANLSQTPIVSYAAKYASAFYGPFRSAVSSTPQFGDRRSYQMDPGNIREAMREIETDIEEGADIVMVKPALPYLDVIARARQRFDIPIAAYNVSGEYAMIKAAAQRGWLDEQRTALETLTAITRAGADLIVTYYAKEATRWLT